MTGSVLLSRHPPADGATFSSPAFLLPALLPAPRARWPQGRLRHGPGRTKVPTRALAPGSSLPPSAALRVKHKLLPGQRFSCSEEDSCQRCSSSGVFTSPFHTGVDQKALPSLPTPSGHSPWALHRGCTGHQGLLTVFPMGSSWWPIWEPSPGGARREERRGDLPGTAKGKLNHRL